MTLEKTVSILGSTGSIGTQSLTVCQKQGYPVYALTAHSNWKLLEQQIRQYRPRYAALTDPQAAKELKDRVQDTGTEVLSGMEGVLQIAADPQQDTVLNAMMGVAGLLPTVTAIEAGNNVALANKETLVAGGKLVMGLAKQKGIRLTPIDSEHSAIFQCLQGNEAKSVKRLIITASGGPFYGKTREELRGIKKEQALKHPNWSMGAKITIDSSTLMNKGLEVIEAMRLYRLPLEQVDVVIHRQSIVHSMVEFTDGAVMAQMGTPDMRLPIQLALTYPERIPSPVERLDLLSCGPLTFSPPDTENFPCLALARDCAKAGGTACPAMNGANEEAVAMFLNDKIGFYDIYRLVNAAVPQVPFIADPTLEQILEADRLAREAVRANS